MNDDVWYAYRGDLSDGGDCGGVYGDDGGYCCCCCYFLCKDRVETDGYILFVVSFVVKRVSIQNV